MINCLSVALIVNQSRCVMIGSQLWSNRKCRWCETRLDSLSGTTGSISRVPSGPPFLGDSRPQVGNRVRLFIKHICFLFISFFAHIYYASCLYFFVFLFCNSLAIYLTFEHTLITFCFENIYIIIYTQVLRTIIYLVCTQMLFSFFPFRTQ